VPAAVGKTVGLIALALIALAAAAVAPASAGETTRGWLDLAGGHLGEYRWTVETKRPDGAVGAGRRGTRRPCLLVGTVWRTGPYSYRRSRSRRCTGRDGLSASQPPLVASGTQPSSGGPAKLTAVGMIFAPQARRLRVVLADGSKRTIHLERLSRRQAHSAGLAPFRYAAFATRGEWCAERLVAENAAGRVLWDSGVDGYVCGGDGAPPRFLG
jgi:hypothetical protein